MHLVPVDMQKLGICIISDCEALVYETINMIKPYTRTADEGKKFAELQAYIEEKQEIDKKISSIRSKNTIGCYLRNTKVFIGWYSSRTGNGFDKLIELDAIEYKRYMLDANSSVVTTNRKMASVNALYKWLYDTNTY